MSAVTETTLMATTVIATLDDLSKEALHKLCNSLCERLDFSNFQNFILEEKNSSLENQVSYLHDQIELRDLSLPGEKADSYEEGFIDGQHCALEPLNVSLKVSLNETSNETSKETPKDTIEIVVINTQEEKIKDICEKKEEKQIYQFKWAIPLLEQIRSKDDSTIQESDSESDNETYSEMADAIEDGFHPVKGKHSKSQSDKILNSFVDDRAKSAFISTEKFVLEKLNNTNIVKGFLKEICENKSVPKEHFASLSSYDFKHNPKFDESFWRKTDGTISNFANIFNQRNPEFLLELKGKGHAATFEKIY